MKQDKRKERGPEPEIFMEQESRNWISYSVPPGCSFRNSACRPALTQVLCGRPVTGSDQRYAKNKRVTGLFISKECKKLVDKHSRKETRSSWGASQHRVGMAIPSRNQYSIPPISFMADPDPEFHDPKRSKLPAWCAPSSIYNKKE